MNVEKMSFSGSSGIGFLIILKYFSSLVDPKIDYESQLLFIVLSNKKFWLNHKSTSIYFIVVIEYAVNI